MDSPSKVELIKQAIKQVMEEVGCDTKSSSDDDGDGDDDRHRLLSKLMSQLERLEGDPETLPSPAASKPEPAIDGELAKANNNTTSRLEENLEEKIVKELKEVKRQNLITHCLLSAMIVLTVAWQISEVSIILKLKEGVRHPFRSIGSMLRGMLIPTKANGDHEEAESSITSNLIESSPVHDLKAPSIPRVELPKIEFGFINED